MKTIIEVALATKFDENQVPNILEICQATGNPEVAVSVLLGIYEEPVIPETAKDTHYEVNRKFSSYDKYKDKVSYTYNRVQKKEAWFAKGDEVNIENIKSKKTWRDDVAKELKINQEEVLEMYEYKPYETIISDSISSSNTSLADWLRD